MTVETRKAEIMTNKMVAKIRTQVDADFVYEYEQSKFVPPAGKTLLIMGQDTDAITQYMDHFSDRTLPGGLTAYWGVSSMKGVDDNNAQDIARQFGLQNHQTLVDEYPNTVLQSGLWMVGMNQILEGAQKGKYDPIIRQFSKWVKTIDRPLYLRIGYEFDGAHNMMEPAGYVKAYRRIVDIMRSYGVENVAYVWQSYAAPTYQGQPLSAWYPGDDYVDWVGISLFGQLYESSLSKEVDNIFNFAKEHKKPVMIAEASPINGIDKEDVDAWDTWFVNLFSLAYQKNVKAISYINANWGAYPGFTDLKWKDARLQVNQQVADDWFKEVEKDKYLKQSEELFFQLGYKM